MDVHYVRFILALLFVLGLIGLFTYLLRRFGFGGIQVSPAFRSKGRNAKRRLAIVESASIDARHRLVLVRRDETEHLLLLGPSSDLLIESDITPVDEPPNPASTFKDSLRASGDTSS